MRVLVVDDHVDLAETLGRVLRREGLAVDLAFTGTEALDLAGCHAYDVVVLDRDLPGVHGDDVCRALVSREAAAAASGTGGTGGTTAAGALPGIPRILMLTASGTVEDRVAGLEVGADDYLPKPFALAELIARVRALGRRRDEVVGRVITVGDVSLDTAARAATRAGRRLDLTTKELAVLEHLMRRAGQVVSAEELLERVWDSAADPFTQTVKVTIYRLRHKVGEPPFITTVPSAGYRVGDA